MEGNILKLFNKVKKVQNKALKIISKTKIRSRITPRYYKYEILKPEDLYNSEIAKLMYQFTHSKLPLNFKHLFAYLSDFHPILPATALAMTFFYRNL